MKYQITEKGIVLPVTPDFNLAQTLDCGQCFRWDIQPDGTYTGVAFQQILQIKEQENQILFEGITEQEFLQIWYPSFDLDLDYLQICSSLTQTHSVLAEAAKFAGGIRILRQDPWEALICFIISQNNNIPRIKGIVQRLCSNFGECIENNCSNTEYYSFPTAERLTNLTVDDLAPLRSGFRAAYILSAAQKIANGEIDLEYLRTLPMEEARKQLMTIHGVGPKVAECALLDGLHRLEAFPMDVWMKRAMSSLFPDYTPADFGAYAGIAQQYIFHYSRCHPDIVKG